MKAILKKCLCLLLTAGLLASLAACAGQTDTAVVKDLFDDLQKVSYSSTYTSLKDNKTNKTDSWRQGMVSGNGLQGFVTSGDPYSDTFIFQNMHFLLPNKNARTCPDTANELETVRRQIIKGQDITDNASYDDVYRYHPGGQLRLAQNKAHAKDYVRYTDYATGQVGVRYTDKNGTWLRRSITSMADGVVITRLDPSTTGTALDLTLSYDDLSTLANFGKSEEVDLQYKKVTAEDGSALGLIAHYPDYENSERKDGGYATLTYVLPVGGTRERVTLDKQTKESQFVGDNTGVRITGASGLVLLTVSDYTLEMGKLSDFAGQTEYPLLADLRAQLEKVAARYSTDGAFDYDAALAAHLKVYQPQFDAVTLTLDQENLQSNEALLKAQKGKKKINAALAQRTYYAGRYAALCCAGYSTGRLYGMWTGEWNTGWGSKYTMDANVNLQTAALNSSNMSRYMDNITLLGPNKKQLHKARKLIAAFMQQRLGLSMKANWQIYPTAKRMVSAVGYRFSRTHVILRKRNFLRFTRQCRRVKKRLDAGKPIMFAQASGLLSRAGQLKHCNSHTIRVKYIDPNDIESINILKGQAASALYGMRAGI